MELSVSQVRSLVERIEPNKRRYISYSISDPLFPAHRRDICVVEQSATWNHDRLVPGHDVVYLMWQNSKRLKYKQLVESDGHLHIDSIAEEEGDITVRITGETTIVRYGCNSFDGQRIYKLNLAELFSTT